MSRHIQAAEPARNRSLTHTVRILCPNPVIEPAGGATATKATSIEVPSDRHGSPAPAAANAAATDAVSPALSVPRPHGRHKSLLWDFSALALFAILATGTDTLRAAETSGPAAKVAAKISPSPTINVLPAPQTAKAPGAASTLWTISTRNARWHHGEAHPTLAYWWYDSIGRRWVPSNREMFLANDDAGVPTCFFVHGNRIGHSEAFHVGWRAYQRVAAHAAPEQPFRFVIWSWPSSRIHGQLKDVRAKAYTSDAHAVYLSSLLDHMNPLTPVSLVGYSYGARLITGSLHILGGGQLVGRSLATRLHPERLPMRVVLMAGALDNYSLRPNARNGLAMTQIDRLLVMTNPTDEVLRYYRLLYGLHGRTQALGTTGAAGVGYEGEKVAHWNVSRFVGSEHDWQRYFNSSSVVAGMRGYTLYTE